MLQNHHDDESPSSFSSSSSIWSACYNGDVAYLREYLATITQHPNTIIATHSIPHNNVANTGIANNTSSNNNAAPSSRYDEINLYNESYETPLHVAVSNNQLECVRLLLSSHHFIAINATDKESGWTALHRACYAGYLSIASLLIHYGADPTITDYEGNTAYDLLITRTLPYYFMISEEERKKHSNDSEEEGTEVKQARNTTRKRQSFDSRRRQADEAELLHKSHIWSSGLHSQVYTLGHNTHYQLGVPVDSFQQKPRLIPLPQDIIHCALTRYASFALTSSGIVYTWGSGASYRLGTGSLATQLTPCPLSIKTKIVHIDADDKYAAAVGDRGEVFVWGTIDFLKRDGEESAMNPNTSNTLNKEESLYVYNMPTRLESCRSLRVVQLSCSSYRLYLLTSSGEVYYLGYALEDHSLSNQPRLLLSMTSFFITAVRASKLAVVVLTKSGLVYQQVARERKASRVIFKFSSMSAYANHANNAANINSANDSPPLSSSSPPLSSVNISSVSLVTSREKGPRIIRISVSPTAERGIAISNLGQCYQWKITEQQQVNPIGTNNRSPTLPSLSKAAAASNASSHSATAATSAASSFSLSSSFALDKEVDGGRRTAHLIAGLSSLMVVDASVANGYTCIVTSSGDIYSFGPNSLLGSSSRPQRLHYLHQASRVWASDQHMIISTLYHQLSLKTFLAIQGDEQSEDGIVHTVPSLKRLCQQEVASQIGISSILAAFSFGVSLCLPFLTSYCLSFILCNLNILIHPILKKCHNRDLFILERYYRQQVHHEKIQGPAEVQEAFSISLSNDRSSSSLSSCNFSLNDPRHPHGRNDRPQLEATFNRNSESHHDSDDSHGDKEEDVSDLSGSAADNNEEIVDLFRLAQQEKGKESLRIVREAREKEARLKALEDQRLEKKKEAEDEWKIGLSTTEIIHRLRSQLRALQKKERRREARRSDSNIQLGANQQDVHQDAKEGEMRRDGWIRIERIKNQIQKLQEEVKQNDTDDKKQKMQEMKNSAAVDEIGQVRNSDHASCLSSSSSAASQKTRSNAWQNDSHQQRQQMMNLAAHKADQKNKEESSAPDRSKANSFTTFSASKVLSRSLLSNPWQVAANDMNSPISILASHSSSSIPSHLSSSPPLSLAEIQAEEERKQQQQRGYIMRSNSPPTANRLSSPPTSPPVQSSNLSSSLANNTPPFMLQLADYIPMTTKKKTADPSKSNQPTTSSTTPPRSWNLNSTKYPSSATGSPPLSIKSIQAEEAQHLQPTPSKTRISASGSSISVSMKESITTPVTSVWGRSIFNQSSITAIESNLSLIQQAEEEESRRLQQIQWEKEEEERQLRWIQLSIQHSNQRQKSSKKESKEYKKEYRIKAEKNEETAREDKAVGAEEDSSSLSLDGKALLYESKECPKEKEEKDKETKSAVMTRQASLSLSLSDKKNLSNHRRRAAGHQHQHQPPQQQQQSHHYGNSRNKSRSCMVYKRKDVKTQPVP